MNFRNEGGKKKKNAMNYMFSQGYKKAIHPTLQKDMRTVWNIPQLLQF
jgi:hypothetical protein